MKLQCFALSAALLSMAANGLALSNQQEELSLSQTGQLFKTLSRYTSTYEYELPALGGLYAGRPLGPLQDLDAMLHPEKIN